MASRTFVAMLHLFVSGTLPAYPGDRREETPAFAAVRAGVDGSRVIGGLRTVASPRRYSTAGRPPFRVVRRSVELVARHGTHGQAAFFLASRGRSLDDVEERHALVREALTTVTTGIPIDWRRADVERAEQERDEGGRSHAHRKAILTSRRIAGIEKALFPGLFP